MMKPIIALLVLLSSVSFPSFSYDIEALGDNLYRFIDERHRSVFLITDEGALITDPMNRKAATWLKAEIKKRFSTPVKYVVYSHNHGDHIYGSEVFDDGKTIFVAHELTKQDILNTASAAVVPDITFQDELVINIGSQHVRLNYHGPNDGRGSISMLFEEQKLLFVVDWIVIGRMPWQKLWSYDIQGMINSTKKVLQYDFSTFVGGHADTGDKKSVKRYLRYLESLYSQVSVGINQGKSLQDIQQSTDLSEFKDLRNYKAWIPLNIEGVYERLMEESGMSWRSDL